jgi:hypothetical protein
MDIAQGFESARFDHSILGSHIRYLLAILERDKVQLLWASNARTMTYVWFKNLQALLYLYQHLATGAMCKTNAGFLPADPHVHVCPYTIKKGSTSLTSFRTGLPIF